MTEVHDNGSSGDEASGGGNNYLSSNKPQRKSSLSGKNFCNKLF
jgi:hypothetical protein